MLLSGADYLQAVRTDQLQGLARIPISAFGAGVNISFVFLGLGSTMFGYLWFKSRYIPRALAALGVFGSMVLAIGSFSFIIFPKLADWAEPGYFAPLGIFEVAMGFWLLFRGLRPSGSSSAG